MCPELDPMPFDLDFMVQETAVFITRHQLELVLLLLDEYVDPISIPEYVRKRLSGVELTVKDVVEIRNGNFHLSGSQFYVRVPSGNLIHIDIIDDYFLLLPTVSSMSDLQRQIQDEYGIQIDDHDILDIFYGAFHVAGPKTIDLNTKEKHFVPRSDLSEAIWMFERGCSADFISRYVRYRFHSRLPAHELVRLALASDEEIVEDAALVAILKSAPARIHPDPTCLKQTARRAPAPLPIMTFPQVLDDPRVEAVQHSGRTYTANPTVICHFDDGTYSLYADFHATPDSASSTSDHSSGTESESDSDSISEDSIMSDVASRVLVHFQDGDCLVNLEQPDRDWTQVPSLASRDQSLEDDHHYWFQSATEVCLDFPVTDDGGIQSLSQMDLDIDGNFDDDLTLQELTFPPHLDPLRSHPVEVQGQEKDTDFAGLLNLGATTFDNLETESSDDLDSLFSDQEGSMDFERERDAIMEELDSLFSDREGSISERELNAIMEEARISELERGNPVFDAIMELDLENGQPQSEILFDVADPSLDDDDSSLPLGPPLKK